MKKFYQFILAMLLIGFSTVGMQAQLTCKESITLELDFAVGMAELTVDSIVTSVIPAGTEVSRSSFSCEDVGEMIVVVASSGDESCETGVTVLDVTPPVPVVFVGINFTLPEGEDSWLLNPHLLDDGSADVCSDIELSVEPEYITCDMIGEEVEVIMTVTDESGNSNYVQTTVNVNYGGSGELECSENFNLPIITTYTVSVEDILIVENSCQWGSLELTDESGAIIADNTIREEHIGEVLTATISSDYNSSSCATSITIVDSPCEEFFVCDTKCNEEPVGDCNSGHTSEDNIEWPCDLLLSGSFQGLASIYPDSLIKNYGALAKDARPVVETGNCNSIVVSFVDELVVVGEEVKVVREWTLIEWNSNITASYTQEITFSTQGVQIIWDTEDFMWPEDAVAKDHRISPNELREISGLSEGEFRPMFINNEDSYIVSYTDAAVSLEGSEVIVDRTWKITAVGNPTLFAQEQQLISVPVIADLESKVFVTTHGGRAMPGVSVNGELTDRDGLVENTGAGDLVLAYEDDVYEGLDVMDVVLMSEHILGISALSEVAYLGSDLDGNGAVTFIDVLLLRKAVLRIQEPEDLGWRFTERPDALVQARGDFISYKMGDVDDSALIQDSVDDDELLKVEIEDQLLNQGEQYTIDFALGIEAQIYAAQLELQLDLGLINVSEVTTFINQTEQSWNVREDGSVIILFNSEEVVNLDPEDVLFSVSFSAEANSTLAEAIRFSSSYRSFLVTSDLEKQYLGLDVENTITSGDNPSPALTEVLLLPNPSNDFIEVRVKEHENFLIDIYDAHGMKVLSTSYSRIDISHLPSGMYVVNGSNKVEFFSSRFVKM